MGILVTGATGNVGIAVLKYLSVQQSIGNLYAGVRNEESAKKKLRSFRVIRFRTFDFQNSATYQAAFQDIDTLFLLRPPHLADVAEVFQPMLVTAKANGIKKVVFLSVQGADKSSWIPHHKIEKLILALGFEYVFLRPGYFMQNLTTTLYPEIQKENTITLPAGKAKFNWVDVENIGDVAACVIANFNHYTNQVITLTGPENRSFGEVVFLMNQVLQTSVQYKAVSPLTFYFKKKRERVPTAMILVMIMLHFLPRFGKEPEIHGDIEAILKRKPTTLDSFFQREKHRWKPKNESSNTKNRT